MSGFHNGKNYDLDSPFPGCLGKMVNLFDLSTGMTGNRLLTDKPYCDGSPLSRRSHSDVSRIGQFEDQIEEKRMLSESVRTCSERNCSGTPMKMLIAQEMSKELDSKRNPPSVVAKLMGLDALPQQQPNLAKQRSYSRGYSRSHSDTLLSYWQHDKGFWDLQMQDKFHHYPQHDEYKDVYEIMQQSPKLNCARDKSPSKGSCDETLNNRKMALVRQKFIEAKRLSTDEKLRQTQQFKDALEVLDSNKDLFIKLLQEPNSLSSQHLYNFQSIPHPTETKRITVLRPCRMVDEGLFVGSGKKNEKHTKKAAQVSQEIGSDKSHPGHSSNAVSWKLNEHCIQPTRIVVLKPSPEKSQDIKAVVCKSALSPILHVEEFIDETEDVESRKSREVAKEITRQMRKNLSGHRKDETLLSSVFLNGYVGDESSFHKSEIEYAAGNLSDSEINSPTSRHSWDYINRFDSPYSSSSFSRASYSPESSVCREAKKRLSERWAMVASNGNYQEQRRAHRSSSTLGEMLALSDTKNTKRNVEEGATEDSEGSTSKLVGDQCKDEEIDKSPRSLVRSKSVPVSSTVFGIQLNADAPDQVHKKTDVSKEAARARSGKSSLKGKVSSLFFSRGKRCNKEKSVASQSKEESLPAGVPSDYPGRSHNDNTICLNDIDLEEFLSPGLHQNSSEASSTDQSGKPGIMSSKAGLSVAKHPMSGNPSENQDQPSPISVLEPPFEADEHTAIESSGNNKPEEHGDLPMLSKSNLIDKSPPIGSIARTLSWDDSCVDTATSYPLKPSFSPQGVEEQEREWSFFVQTLLSLAALDGEMQSDIFLGRWHSSESPLDPSLRIKYINLNDKDILHEAMRRQRRSTRKLVFDCVNAALVDIAGYGPDMFQRKIPCNGHHKTLLEGASFMLMDQVWARIKEWFSVQEMCVTGDYVDNNSLVVESLVRKEVVGKGWLDHLRLEMDNLGKEIEQKLLEELVQEAVVELTG